MRPYAIADFLRAARRRARACRTPRWRILRWKIFFEGVDEPREAASASDASAERGEHRCVQRASSRRRPRVGDGGGESEAAVGVGGSTRPKSVTGVGMAFHGASLAQCNAARQSRESDGSRQAGGRHRHAQRGRLTTEPLPPPPSASRFPSRPVSADPPARRRRYVYRRARSASASTTGRPDYASTTAARRAPPPPDRWLPPPDRLPKRVPGRERERECVTRERERVG